MKRPSIEIMEDLRMRFFIACPRSGSALFMRIFVESLDCAVTSSPLITRRFAAVGIESIPHYSIPRNLASHKGAQPTSNSDKRILICKAGFDDDVDEGGYIYELLKSSSNYPTVIPVFLLRDPIRVFDSWKKAGWIDIQSFINCFNRLFQMLEQADSSLVSCLLYEQFVQEPSREVERVCAFWGIPFSDAMLEFSVPFGASFLYESTVEKDTYYHQRQSELFTTISDSTAVVENVPCHGLVTNDEKNTIENSLGRFYIQCWRDHVLHLRDSLAKMRWIGFDLDDTLHEFRRASSAASNKVLQTMQERYGIPLTALKSRYSEILRTSTSNAFTDGKSSSDYRRERFLAVANHFSLSLEQDDLFLSQLLHLYKAALKESLELKSGALGLLETIKRLGKKIVVITEGPQDAQEWTVENLGISHYVDFLATTNYFKVSKTDGLFTRVLEALDITPSEIAYVGDSEYRDMQPAIAEGILSFHFPESLNCNLERYPPHINTLNKLEYIFSLSGEKRGSEK